MTQHEKIYEFAKDGAWHCQHEFWAVSHSPHKRRAEMSQDPQYEKDFLSTCRKFHIYHFEERECVHGVDRAKDYKIAAEEESSSEKIARRENPLSVKTAAPRQLAFALVNGVSVPIFAPKKETKNTPFPVKKEQNNKLFN